MKNLCLLFGLLSACVTNAQNLDSFLLKTVVISGNKSKVKKLKVVQTIDKIKSEDIQLQQSTNAAQTLQNTGMISVQKSQNGGGSPIVRGFEANRVLIVVDGVRMNTAIFRGGHLQNVLRVNHAMIDNVEILYGPSSTLYGSDALGGTLVFNTRKPRFNKKFKTEAAFNYATANDEKNASVILSYGAKKWATLTSLTLSDFGSLRMGSNFSDRFPNFGKRNFYQGRIGGRDTMLPNDNPLIQKNSGYSQYDILQKFSFLNKNNSTHNINLQYSTTTDVPRFDRQTDLTNGVFKNAEWYYGPERRLMIGYGYDHLIESKLSDRIKANISYQRYDESRHTRRWNDNDKLSQYEKVDVITAEVNSNKKIKNHDFTVGTEFVHNIVNSEATSHDIVSNVKQKAITRYAGNGSQTSQFSVFFQDIMEVSPGLSYANFGIRASYYTLTSNVDTSIVKYPFDKLENDAFSVTGNMGMNFRLSKQSLLSMNVSSGFRNPNVDDMSKIFDNSNFITINQGNLTPEQTLNFEAKWQQFLGSQINFEVGGYYTRLYDVIVSKPSSLNGDTTFTFQGQTLRVYSLANEENGYVTGAFGGLNVNFSTKVSLKAKTNFTYGRVSSGAIQTPLDHIPPMTTLIGLHYKTKELRASLNFQHNSEKRSEDYRVGAEDNERYSYDPVNGYMPSWYILNFNSLYKLNKNLTILGGVDNILDRNYRVFASGIQSAGRNFKLGLRAKF